MPRDLYDCTAAELTTHSVELRNLLPTLVECDVLAALGGHVGGLSNNLPILNLGLAVETEHFVAGFLVDHQLVDRHDCVPPSHVPLVGNPVFDLTDARTNEELFALARLERQEATQASCGGLGF
jgi:hypothetical protein